MIIFCFDKILDVEGEKHNGNNLEIEYFKFNFENLYTQFLTNRLGIQMERNTINNVNTQYSFNIKTFLTNYVST